MANEIAKTNPFGNTVSVRNATEMADAVQTSAQRGALGQAPDGCDYLNFTGKRGVYEFGADKEGIDKREMWLVNVASFEDGFVCWKGGSPVGTRLANIYTQPPVAEPDPDELGPFNTNNGEGWHKAKSMVLRSIDEDDKQGYFKINSKSGVAVFSDLQNEVADRMRQGRPYWPVVTLDAEKFTAKGNVNFKPKITVYGWIDDARCSMLATDPSADIDELIELSEKGAQTEDEPDEQEEEAPTTRRRRRL